MTVAPPLRSAWWNGEDTVAAVLAKLRLTDGDVDEERIRNLVPAAADLIDTYLDRECLTPPAAALQEALEHVTIKLYGGGPQSGSNDAVSPAMVWGPVDPLAEVIPMITGYKQRWGVA